MRASFASQADYAKNAYQATIASMSLESQKLNQAGDMIMIDPANHYVIMVGANQDPTTSIIFDLVNRTAINLKMPSDESVSRLEARLNALESLMAEK
jgi:7-keto-8-aminopelargonate synthetase-like enzyme